MKDRLTLFTKYLLDVLFYAGIVVTVTLPLGIRFYGKYALAQTDDPVRNFRNLCIDTFAGAAKDV